MSKTHGSSAPAQRALKKGSRTKRRKKFSDIPGLTEVQLAGMHPVGRPPLGEQPRNAISIRVDQQVLDWMKCRAADLGQPYRSLINEILAKAMRRAR